MTDTRNISELASDIQDMRNKVQAMVTKMAKRNVVKTPGFNCRVAIFFQNDKNGRKVAYYWTWRSGRAIRMSLTDAELFVAQNLADYLPCHPMKG